MRFDKWTFNIVPNKEIVKWEKPIVQAVYFWLCDFSDSKTMSCYPSFKTLASCSWCSRRACIEAIKRLEEIGIIRKHERHQNNEQKSNLYYVIIIESEPDALGSAGDSPPSEWDALEGSAWDAHRTTPIYSNPPIQQSSSKEEQATPEYGKKDINDLIEIIKEACSKNWLLYSGKWHTERNAAKRLLSKTFSKRISDFWMSLEVFVNNVVMVSTKLKYNTKQVTSAKLIYYNWEEIVNKAKQQSAQAQIQEPSQKKSPFAPENIVDLTPYLNS